MLGVRVRELRKSSGYSRREIAELLQIGEATVQRIEEEKQDPSSEIVAKLARFFGVSADYLMGLSDKPSGTENLTPEEALALAAWRNGDIRRAIRAIIGNE
jgi:transcriptional regulator with XRE-family HTH domain